SGHAAAPPSRMTKSRRRIPDTRAPPSQSVRRILSLPPTPWQVLGAGLNCSESEGCALYHLYNGLNRAFLAAETAWRVVFRPQAVIRLGHLIRGETDGQMQPSRGATAENCATVEDTGRTAPTHPDGAVA